MNIVSTLFYRFASMLFSKFSSPYTVKVVEDYLPREMEKKVLYIVVDDGYMEQAAMICPCGCRKILQMNMLPDERPCWRLKKNIDGSHSLNPSIWRKKDCFSHFWFKNNRVHWCRGGGPWWNRF